MNKEEVIKSIKENIPDDVFIVGFDIFYLKNEEDFYYSMNDYCKFKKLYINDIKKLLMSRFFFEENESSDKEFIDYSIKLLEDINKEEK